MESIIDVIKSASLTQGANIRKSDLIASILDKVWREKRTFRHLTDNELEYIVRELPQGCFYSSYLKREWNARRIY